MTYARPTYAELNDRISADLGAVPAVLRSPLSVMWSRCSHGMHGMLDWIHAQCSPLSCEEERLHDWAALYGVPKLLARAASGHVIATGAEGSIVLADSILRGANGLDYTILSAVVLGAGDTVISVICTTAGEDGNLAAGGVLTLVDPIVGVNGSMTVAPGGLTGGAADEDVDSWRLRVADEWQTVVTSGARAGKPEDYRAWSKSAHQSVTTALVQLHVLGIGSVLVRPICNELPNRQPTQGVLDAIGAYFEAIVPGTADWRLTAPIPHVVSPSIHLLAGYDTAQNRAAIRAAINSTIMAETTETSVLLLAEIDAAIQTVTDQYNRISPLENIAAQAGEVFVLGDILWV